MKLSELLPFLDNDEDIQITALNDLGSDCVIKEISASDLRDPESPAFKADSFGDPPTGWLLGREVSSVRSRCVVSAHDVLPKDGEETGCRRMCFKAVSLTVVRLDLSIGEIDRIRRAAWITGAQGNGVRG